MMMYQNSVVRNFRTTAADGKKYATNFYNLDAIISLGYRVNYFEYLLDSVDITFINSLYKKSHFFYFFASY